MVPVPLQHTSQYTMADLMGIAPLPKGTVFFYTPESDADPS